MVKIGVESSLTAVKQALEEKGYEVIELKNESDAQNCDVCIVTGMDQNVMGIHDTVTEGPVIDASGMSAEDVCREVESRINL